MNAPANQIYMDYNATAPVKPEAARAVSDALALTGNPSSVHGAGRKARAIIEDARESVAQLVGAEPAEVIFTSGGTEANNLALTGLTAKTILISAVEHDSVMAAADRAAGDVDVIPVTPEGVVDLSALEALLDKAAAPVLVSVMFANNETGVIQPVERIAQLVHAYGAMFHCDAIQGAGKVPVDMTATGADLMSLSAHKIGGPQGVGALIVRDGIELSPQITGGGQERKKRAGTENMPAIAGFGAAAKLACADVITNALNKGKGINRLRDKLEAGALEIAPDLHIFGLRAERLPNTSCLTLPGVAAETQVMALDLAGVMIGAGSACSSGKVEPSHVLKAMGAGEEETKNAIRISLGWQSTEEDVDAFLAEWKKLYERTVSSKMNATGKAQTAQRTARAVA